MMVRPGLVLACCALLVLALSSLRGGDALSLRPTKELASRQIEATEPPREVTHLPGYSGEFRSKHLTGYINVDKDHGKHMFYYVVQSEGSVKNDPIILWLTGGPGCSGIDAFIYEHGPFSFGFSADGSDVELTENAYAWSKSATMIYVDSPVGTGLSYSDTKTDYTTNDTATVRDLAAFMQGVLAAMPELSTQDFYIAGESYAGVYAPMLAAEILARNKEAAAATAAGGGSSSSSGGGGSSGTGDGWAHIHLQGYMLGNGVTDDMAELNGQVEFAYGMGFIDPTTYEGLVAACQGSYWNAPHGSECATRLEAAWKIFYWVNKYDVLTECHMKTNTGAAPGGKAGVRGPGSGHAAGGRHRSAGMLQHTVQCGDRSAALQWLAMPEVRTALGAVSVDRVAWEPCSDILDYYVPFPINMVALHRQLLGDGLRALIYSGDHDMVVPFTSTRAWVYGMDLRVEQPYDAWLIDRQVAGFVSRFSLGHSASPPGGGLTFATVKGAGHMVPTSNPHEALELISRWMQSKL
ncbi:hypothetical protein FOA52_002825 [Chlamydomonas sp. UWO 241]|nr:hypothetical protein FOA52_002825 [Chlamydomonas sp. UWO 241]